MLIKGVTMKIENVKVSELIPYERNAKKQVEQ